MTEKEKMILGKLYDCSDAELTKARIRAHDLCTQYNNLSETDINREKIIKEIFPNLKKGSFIQGPLHVDYGFNVEFGEYFYANFNLTILDCAKVTIGTNVLIGPNCSIMPPNHGLSHLDRKIMTKEDGTIYDLEYAKPITIGDDVWIASNVVICGGVKIGNRCVIGAGSVVTRDIPDDSLAFGSPAKVIRKITEKDRNIYKKELY